MSLPMALVHILVARRFAQPNQLVGFLLKKFTTKLTQYLATTLRKLKLVNCDLLIKMPKRKEQ